MNILLFKNFSAVEDVVTVEPPWQDLKDQGVYFRVIRIDHPDVQKQIGESKLSMSLRSVVAMNMLGELMSLQKSAESDVREGETPEERDSRVAQASEKLQALTTSPKFLSMQAAIDVGTVETFERQRRALALVICRDWSLGDTPCTVEEKLEVFGFDGVAVFVDDEPHPRLMTHGEYRSLQSDDWLARAIAKKKATVRVYRGGLRGDGDLLLRVPDGGKYAGESLSDALVSLCLDASRDAAQAATKKEEEEVEGLGPTPAGEAVAPAG